jgi:hypothetical protein
VVTGLTAGALAVVTVLALQAQGSVKEAAPKPPPPAAGHTSGPSKPAAPAIPAGSGTGKRVVYSLKAKRVWLVKSEATTAERTFAVQPSAVSPLPGTYSVIRENRGPGTGSDGTRIENTVIFAFNQGVTIGFSAAVNGSTASPTAARTGGIRESRADGKALYAFADLGDKVVVVP